MKSLGKLMFLGAALALLVPTSSWADHTDTGSRHGIRRPARTNPGTHNRADHRHSRPKHRPSLSLRYSRYGDVIVRFGYRDGHNYRRRAHNQYARYYSRHHRRHHDYDRHYYEHHYHRGHH